MAGNTLDLRDLIVEDQLGVSIARKWVEWNMFRQEKMESWEEVRRYVYATDTTTTANSSLPWKNKTTLPKLCQIRDNLYANYRATLFPKRKWLRWEASDEASMDKKDSITQYMSWAIDQEQFKSEMDKLILDYIDYGNTFITVEWMDERADQKDKEQVGYVGPIIKRISPLDIVFNPTASSFSQAPKIVRSVISVGEVKELIERMTTDDNKAEYEELFNYLMNIRREARDAGTYDLDKHDDIYRIDGFGSYRQYLDSDYIEILTFYGDMFDKHNDKFYKNHQIMVIDRHKVLSCKPHPSIFGHAPIYHASWRKRQDNLWGMGPLENLVGMQFKVDHIENIKADALDLIVFPTLKVKGIVEDFDWQPFQKIFVGDEGDVMPVQVPFQVLQLNSEVQFYMGLMEETAGAPKEAMGFRSPGEKTKYEIQRLENASSRIFANKCLQFEVEIVEVGLNAMLEMARRKLVGTQIIPVFNDEFQFQTFTSLTAQDITGAGKLKPVAARHFAERADIVQNLTQFFSSPIGQDPAVKAHFSAKRLATLFEDLLDISDYNMVQPYIRLDEEAEGQRMAMEHQAQNQQQMQTPRGLTPEDSTLPFGAPVQ